MWAANSLEKTLMLGKTEGKRRRGWRKWDGWMVSTQWTWVWANSRRWWRTGRADVLQSTGLQRVGQDWSTEQQQLEHSHQYDSNMLLFLPFPTPTKKIILDSRRWHPTPVLLPGKSHWRRSLVGCSPWGREESDTTERLHFHFPLSWIGEGNGNPLQCSCLENPRDGEAWWAAVYGASQSRTQLKRLSSSSSTLISRFCPFFCPFL